MSVHSLACAPTETASFQMCLQNHKACTTAMTNTILLPWESENTNISLWNCWSVWSSTFFSLLLLLWKICKLIHFLERKAICKTITHLYHIIYGVEMTVFVLNILQAKVWTSVKKLNLFCLELFSVVWSNWQVQNFTENVK